MARLKQDGTIRYGKGELQSTPPFEARDEGHADPIVLNPSDPAQCLGFLPGQTLSRQLFPDPLEKEPDMTWEIARRVLGRL